MLLWPINYLLSNVTYVISAVLVTYLSKIHTICMYNWMTYKLRKETMLNIVPHVHQWTWLEGTYLV
jgi:hypothetical protein